MKNLILVTALLLVGLISNAQHQTIGLDYSLGFKPSDDKFTFDGKEIGNYSLGWYKIPGSAEANLSGYGGINFFTEKEPRLTITKHGNIGIGTTNPSSKLHIKADELGTAINDQSILTTIEGSVINNNSKFQILNKRNSIGPEWSNTSLRLQRVVDSTPQAFIDFGIDGKNSSYGLAFGTRNGFSGNQTVKMVIEETGNVGIGTVNPIAALDVGQYIPDETLGTVFGHLYEGDEVGDGTFLGVKGHQTQGSDFLNIKSFSIIHNFYGKTNSSINFYRGGSTTGGFISFNTNNDDEKMRILGNGNVGIGTTDTKGYKLAVAGKVIAEEVKVELQASWPDYVFEENYDLPTLEETENFIKENGHLKEIPNAQEVEDNGIHLGEMNAKLLQKIEELTLYTIKQGKAIKDLQIRLDLVEAKK